jgi:hypothetical protein
MRAWRCKLMLQSEGRTALKRIALNGARAIVLTSLLICTIFAPARWVASEQAERSWACQVLPPEREITTDEVSGATVIFVTTDQADDLNFYFHERSWLPDGSMLVFTSQRTGRSEPFGYVEQTGELVRLGLERDPAGTAFTAARYTNSLYLVRDGAVFDWAINVIPGTGGSNTKVRVQERKICNLPPNIRLRSALNDNATGTYLSLGFNREGNGADEIVAIEKATGKIVRVAQVEGSISHVQFSWTDPEMVMFARYYPGGDRAPLTDDETDPGRRRCRFWFTDFSDRPPWPSRWQRPGELVTHECWWVDNLVTFCGAYREEESHVKLLDLRTGVIRIIGAGSWWADGTPFELSKRNWWHAAGDPRGRWVAADNWHGDIVLFDARTTEERLLAHGHRTYGGGAHPHVGWAPTGDRVVFASNRRGNADVCIAIVPEEW